MESVMAAKRLHNWSGHAGAIIEDYGAEGEFAVTFPSIESLKDSFVGASYELGTDYVYALNEEDADEKRKAIEVIRAAFDALTIRHSAEGWIVY